MIVSNQNLKKIMPAASYYGPCSIDLRLGMNFARIDKKWSNVDLIDMNDLDSFQYIKFTTDQPVFIKPHEFMLATTKEDVFVPNNMAAHVEGRSSIGRLGLQIQNAGFIDSGFKGEITLELCNQTDMVMKIYPGMRICQLVYIKLDEETISPYNGKYQNQCGATVSKFEGIE